MKSELLDAFSEIKECVYKSEHYSVRDNGSILRHHRTGMRIRKLDDVWCFGKPNPSSHYLEFCGERVHRIVATAFHGSAPSNQHVVDHIDTNRQNNRPENLRWLSKLENILNNEITRKKVELICGSIEAFLQNPQLLYGYEKEDQNFIWMRTVTKEEARISLARMSEWAKYPTKPNGGTLGEWIFLNSHELNNDNSKRVPSNINDDYDAEWKAIQRIGIMRLGGSAQIVDTKRDDVVEQTKTETETQSLTPNAI